MTLTFLPAIWGGVLRSRWVRWVVSPLTALDPRLQGTPADHPFVLTSFALPEWRDQRFVWEPEEFVFGDSGGYSAATRGLTFNPRDVMRWQIKYCTVGAILDAPPWRDWTRRPECLARTVANVKAFLPLYRRARRYCSPTASRA